jgi:hypothetical protein
MWKAIDIYVYNGWPVFFLYNYIDSILHKRNFHKKGGKHIITKSTYRKEGGIIMFLTERVRSTCFIDNTITSNQ